jgi:hypothetical protein
MLNHFIVQNQIRYSEMNKNLYEQFVRIVLTFFVSYLKKKIKLKDLACSFELPYFENPSNNPLQRS